MIDLKFAGNMFNEFKTEKIDDQEYYKIVVNEEKYVKTVWINKTTLIIKKATITFPTGEPLEYEYELKFTAVKLSSIDLPNLENYEIIEEQ